MTLRVTIREIQKRLAATGHYKGRIDGHRDAEVDRAIVSFKASVGLRQRPYIGPKTWAALVRASSSTPSTIPSASDAPFPPWLEELGKVMGLHEVHDKAALTEWLASDGHALGSPTAFPWCGDAAETAILRALPNEPLRKDTRENPYWARNWQTFGVPCGAVLGAALPMSRGPRNGHICFAVGISRDGRKVYGRGGNQNNRVSDAWFPKDRILAWRWPKTYPTNLQRPLPVVDDRGRPLSRNEA